jgi:hypothetical protein
MLKSNVVFKFQKVKISSEAEGHNQCPSCGKEFRTLAGFDKHRVGQFGTEHRVNSRRCLTTSEMLAIGMSQGRYERWITKANNLQEWKESSDLRK